MTDGEVEATDLVVGQDSNLVLEGSTNDKIEILSHEGMDTTDRPGQIADDQPGPAASMPVPEKAQNKANFKSTKGYSPLQVKSCSSGLSDRKRSQSARRGAGLGGPGSEPIAMVMPASDDVGKAPGGELGPQANRVSSRPLC